MLCEEQASIIILLLHIIMPLHWVLLFSIITYFSL